MKKTNTIYRVIALVVAVAVMNTLSACGGNIPASTQADPTVTETAESVPETSVDIQDGQDFFDDHGGSTIVTEPDDTDPDTTEMEPDAPASTGNNGGNSGTSVTTPAPTTAPSGNGNSNGNNNGGNGNGGNGGTTTTQPTYATEPEPQSTCPTGNPGHWETRVIAEAWDETVVDQEAWDEEVKTAVGTQWTQNDTGTDMTGWTPTQQMNWCESHNCPNHCDEYDPSQPGYCAANRTGKTIYETQIIHHDAVTHVVHHDAVTEQVWVED